MLLQMGEVAGEQRRLIHRLVRIQLQMEYLWIERGLGPKDIRLEMNMGLVQQHCTLELIRDVGITHHIFPAQCPRMYPFAGISQLPIIRCSIVGYDCFHTHSVISTCQNSTSLCLRAVCSVLIS